jgi:hypothetical protein
MAFIKIMDYRVVLMEIGSIFVTCGNTVPADHSTIHKLCWIYDSWQDPLGIHSIYIGIMKQTLGDQHIDICNFRQFRIFICLL